MELGVTGEQISSPIWLIGHSYPENWVEELDGPLDPRHPTRHSIWTPVLDQLQQHVYRNGDHGRINIDRCFISNAAAKQADKAPPDWDWKGKSILSRIQAFSAAFKKHQPKMIITFGEEVYRFALAARDDKPASSQNLTVISLPDSFRAAVSAFEPTRINVLPLLHASVARKAWNTAGVQYTKNPDGNYFTYVGDALGGLLLTYGLGWPVWEQKAKVSEG